ncbi:MAG: hypothetical protein H6765_02610 [Candidatus Peribacteria bacterium]|nr:MAG: hypothetical protein H6765_02610 [Candidatus Peribacteria bacterium]
MGTNFNHTKTFILDDDTYIISTANLSYTSMRKNREYRFVGHNAAIVQSLQMIFAKDWKGIPLFKKDIHPNLLVCPVDCREKLMSYILSADKSLVIATQYIQDEELISLLQDKAKYIPISIIVSDNQEPGWLENFGTGVKYLGEPYLHAKNILIDDKALIIGSMNLSSNAMDHNREISIAITDSSAIRDFKKQFTKDRDIAQTSHSQP